MTPEKFNAMLTRLLDHKPFQAFTVELKNGQSFEIDGPRAAVLRDGMAIFIGVGFKIFEFDHEKVNRFIEAPASTQRKKRKPSKL